MSAFFYSTNYHLGGVSRQKAQPLHRPKSGKRDDINYRMYLKLMGRGGEWAYLDYKAMVYLFLGFLFVCTYEFTTVVSDVVVCGTRRP